MRDKQVSKDIRRNATFTEALHAYCVRQFNDHGKESGYNVVSCVPADAACHRMIAIVDRWYKSLLDNKEQREVRVISMHYDGRGEWSVNFNMLG